MINNYSKNPGSRPKVMSPEGEQIGEVVSIDVNDETGNEPVALDMPLGTEMSPEDAAQVFEKQYMSVKIDPDSETFKKIKEGANMSVSIGLYNPHEADALINIKSGVI